MYLMVFIKKYNYYFIVAIVSILCTALSSFFIYRSHYKEEFIKLNDYMKAIYKVERQFIENFPTYADYIDPEKENSLRKYLKNHHIEAARKPAIKTDRKNSQKQSDSQKLLSPITNDENLKKRIFKKDLVVIDDKFKEIAFFYNVPKKYRYLSPRAHNVLWILGKRFQSLIKKKGINQFVKFAISSAVRPMNYQNNLININANASLKSSHSYGASFDIFYDEFFIDLYNIDNKDNFTKPKSQANNESDDAQNKFYRTFLRQTGFLMGQALRRQLRAVLHQAIIELQNENIIYAILEKRQRCYHITAR